MLTQESGIVFWDTPSYTSTNKPMRKIQRYCREARLSDSSLGTLPQVFVWGSVWPSRIVMGALNEKSVDRCLESDTVNSVPDGLISPKSRVTEHNVLSHKGCRATHPVRRLSTAGVPQKDPSAFCLSV